MLFGKGRYRLTKGSEKEMDLGEMKKLRLAALSVLVFGGFSFVANAELVFEDSKKVYAATEENEEDTAEIVYEDAVEQTAPVENRRVVRRVIRSAPAPQAAPTVIVQAAPQQPAQTMGVATSFGTDEPQSKAELLRRERMRNELQNEDLLQARLEDLRLKDEEKRIDGMFGKSGKKTDEENYESPYATATAVDTYQVGPVAQANPPAPQDQYVYTQAAPVPMASEVDSSKTGEDEVSFYVSPRAGISDFSDNSSYKIDSRFAAGIGMGFTVSDYFSIEGGYTYSEYDVSLQDNYGFQPAWSGYVAPYGNQYPYNNANYNEVVMKQNVFDTIFKLHLMSRKSKFRPFIGAGLGYGKSFINYDERTLQWLKAYDPSQAKDYTLSQYLGILTAGIDVQVSDSVAVGLTGRFYNVFSAKEDGPLYNYAFYNPGNSYNNGGFLPPPPGFNNYTNDQKALVTGSLAESNFFNVSLGVNFTF